MELLISFLIRNGFYFTDVEPKVNFEKEKNDINFVPRKDIKSLFKCTDTTVAKLFNGPDFLAIMIGEHKVEKSALKKWLQERRT